MFQDNISATQIISKYVSITKSKENSKQVQTVSYVLKDFSTFRDQELMDQRLLQTESHEWSPEEEYSWNVGRVYKDLPLSTDTWSAVLNEFRVRWPETPLLFSIQGTTLQPHQTTSTDTFNKSQWSGSYDSWEGLTYDNYNLLESQSSLKFYKSVGDEPVSI